MNTKAEKMKKFLDENMPNIFQIEEVPNHELHAAVFNTFMEVDKQNLPFMLIVDDSIYVMFQTRLANGVINEKNRTAVMEHLNTLNETYKIFKYYIDENGSIIIECCIPSADGSFEPGIVHAAINVVYTHLGEEYKNIMKLVWAN